MMSAEVQDLLIRRASTDEIRLAARANGMKTMREDALAKLLQGMIPVGEALRALESDRWPA